MRLKSVKPLLPPKAGFVAEEEQHRGIGQRLRDDREVDPLDARAEGEVAEDEGDQRRHDEHQQHRPEEAVAADPEPGQFLPVEEDHEIGQIGLIAAVAADLPHQVHAETVTPEGEEEAVPERENPAIAPDEVHGDGDDRVAEDLADQRDEPGRQVQRVVGGQHEVHHWHGDQCEGGEHADHPPTAGIEAVPEADDERRACRSTGSWSLVSPGVRIRQNGP
jgi:hypothetical protein